MYALTCTHVGGNNKFTCVFSSAVTTNVFAVTVTQRSSCSIEITCHFASGSSADACQVFCRTGYGHQTIQELTLLRETSSDSNTTIVSSTNIFPNDTLIGVEAVGVENGRLTDTSSVFTSFQVIQVHGMDCQHNTCTFCMP